MPIHQEHYLTCSNCGTALLGDDGETLRAESEEELIDLAEDAEWLIERSHALHVCPDCQLTMGG